MTDHTPATLAPEQVESWRDIRYRRREQLRLHSSQQALEFVDQVGFCFLFPVRTVEMPSLWDAICGETRPLPAGHEDVELGYAWSWKDELPSRGLIFYGKLVFKKPTLISLDLLPHFYALSENYGDIEDYLLEYQDGKLSEEAKRVYEALLQYGALPTSHLRRRAGLDGKGNAPRFDRAIRELQLGLKIVKTGISDANAWGYCYVYDVMLRHWPDLARRAGAISSQEAMRVLLLTYLRNVGVTTLADIVRVFAWDLPRLTTLCQQWVAKGELLSSVRVEGWSGDYLAWPGIAALAEHDAHPHNLITS
jgi:hypothetical protein